VESALLIVGLAAVAFAATNLDNLILLVGFVSRPSQPFAPVVVGALLSGLVMLILCACAALAAGFAPERWLGWLGLVPLGLGLRDLGRMLAARGAPTDAEAALTLPAVRAPSVAGVMLANSADSFGALVPLFAETRHALLPLIGAVILTLSLLACLAARSIASHPRIGPTLRTLAPRLVPFVLILVGLYILTNTRTDTLL
jgi:cadmium resistance protein CadD (predicted permease)